MKELSRILMVTGQDPKNKTEFLNKLIIHLENGIRLIQLRAKELSISEYSELASEVTKIGKRFNANIILNTNIEIVQQLDADGIHLNSSLLMKTIKRPLPSKYIVSAACHDLEQLKQARKIEVDIVTLSPVCRTKTHLDAVPLGWTNFNKLCKSVDLAVYALGGVDEKNLDLAISCGAYGIAAINSLWNKQYP